MDKIDLSGNLSMVVRFYNQNYTKAADARILQAFSELFCHLGEENQFCWKRNDLKLKFEQQFNEDAVTLNVQYDDFLPKFPNLHRQTRTFTPRDKDYGVNVYQYGKSSHDGLGPAAVIYPKGVQNILKMVDYAIKNNLGFAVRTGGHQYSGTLLCR